MKTLTRDQLKSMLTQHENFKLINVLSPNDFSKAHIPGSANIPVEKADFTKQVEQKAGGKNQKIVVYCAGPSCDAAPKAAKKLEEAGFKNVYDYTGGIQEWQEAGNPVEKGF